VEDRDLVRQALDGDVRAYRRLIERYRNAVYGLAISFVGDFDLAEDMAQEAFILGYYRLGTLTDRDRFGVWLRTITANLCRMELRRRRAAPVEDGAFDADRVAGPGPAPDVVYEQDAIRRQVREALMGLSEKDRETVTLYYLEGLTVEEVGRFLDVSGAAVKGRLHRARKQLQKEMMGMVKRPLSGKKPEPALAKRVDIRSFADWTRLTDQEIQTTLRHVNTKDLATALKGEGKGTRQVEERTLSNVSDRVRGMIQEFMASTQVSPEEIKACQRRILHLIWWVQISGLIRPPSRKPTRRQYERALREKAMDRIEMGRLYGRWTPTEAICRELVPYLAIVARDEGIEEAKKIFQSVREPVLELGVNLLAERVEKREMIRRLQECAESELKQADEKFQMLIKGMAAIRDGVDPQDIGARLAKMS
jgi:RNA polymerase sigma-70 factor (ECF subfamily)